MACSLADTKLVFESSGIEVIPFDVDFRTKRGKLDYAKARLTRTAGEYIAEQFDEFEPVRIEVDGHVIRRLMLVENPIKLGVDHAFLTLADSREILKRGVIDKVFHKATLGEVLDYIYEQTDDPNGVLIDARASDPGMEGIVTEDYQEKYEWFFATNDYYKILTTELEEWGDNVSHKALRFINNLTGLLGKEGGFDFNGITPAEALYEVEQQFGLESWVDDDGVLWIGKPDVMADLYFASGEGSDTLRIKEYNVTEDAIPVAGVKIGGTYTITMRSNYYGGPNRTLEKTKLQSWAVARWTTKKNGRMIVLDSKKVIKGEDLAIHALTRLLSEIYDSKGGNVVLNPLASSTVHGHPAAIRVGDHLAVVGNIHEGCNQKIESDLFVVNGLHHRISSEVGWEITADVGKLVNPDELEVDFWYFDPTNEEMLEPEEVYKLSIEDD